MFDNTRIKRPETAFQNWMWNNMERLDYSISDIADILKTSRWSVSRYYNQGIVPAFRILVEFCFVFGLDDPDWELEKLGIMEKS